MEPIAGTVKLLDLLFVAVTRIMKSPCIHLQINCIYDAVI
jgi:hypothetical protein